METLGTHLLAELWGCDADLINSASFVEMTLVDAAVKSGAHVLHSSFHEFAPQGISGVVIISESHLTIHSWPEYGYAAIDVFTCGKKVDPWFAVTYIEEQFKSSYSKINNFSRGKKPIDFE